ncbi:MAG: S9 family peptidase [Acidobacteria bacterium]|nr:S9 family peptidase [Acidobacteriota bacterium]
MHSRSLTAYTCLLLLYPSQGGWAQDKKPAKFELTIENIMRGPALYGNTPLSVRWSGDGQRVYFRWKRHDEAIRKELSTYVVNRDGSGLRKLTEEEEKEAPPLGGSETRDWKLSVYASEGDLFLYDLMTSKRHRLTKTNDIETNPRFTHDEKRITYMRSNNLFVLTPRDGLIEQVTDVRSAGAGAAGAAGPAALTGGGGRGQRGGGPPMGRSGAGGTETKGTDSQEFLKKEERDLLAIVKERAAKREEDEAKKKKEGERKPLTLTAQQSITSMQLSADDSFVVASVQESAERAKSTIVPNYINTDAYTVDIPSRSKVGDEQGRQRIALIRVKTGEVKWVEHGIKEKDADGKERDRDVRLSRPMFSDDGGKLVVMARAADNKDTWILAVDANTGKSRVLATEHDDAWVNSSPTFSSGWLADNKRIYFLSERDGWRHLYTVDYESGEVNQLTSGKWEVRGVELTPDRSQFLLTTSETHAGEDQLFRMSVHGGDRKRLTKADGGHDARMSPDGAMLATVHSYTNKPPELYLQDVATGKMTQVTHSPAPEFSSYRWVDTPIVQIPARDGALVPAHMYKPANWTKGGPLVIFVHGAGYLQNVRKQWSSYAREYMFHHLLMERGYMVLDLDYRASAGYGRDWRTGIYRHMGGKDLDDHVDAVQWAVKEHGVDARRVGLYGGSYGGFITLMALFTQPEVFAAGAALRPVTDWAHYNHQYTSNILNIPQKDVEAYRRSSPIYHAQGLKGKLLICHGMVDINVHFQDTVRLVQRLIELGKENWELAVYPVEDHGFVQPSSWADEYRRILRLFEASLSYQ